MVVDCADRRLKVYYLIKIKRVLCSLERSVIAEWLIKTDKSRYGKSLAP